jgi:hypothetical protein
MSNPLGFFYRSTENWQKFAGKTGMLVTGRCNRYDPDFAKAREAGAEVLAYLDVIERPDHRVCELDQSFYMNDYGKVPLWPYPVPGTRRSHPRHQLTDIREGSPWIKYLLEYIHKLMDDQRMSGLFLDVVGARLWQRSGWDNWPAEERAEWTNGCVAFVRELDRLRRQGRKNFIVVNNNFWSPDGKTFVEGEKYVDGICIEHHPITRTSAVLAAGRRYSDLGHRRVLWIAKSPQEARVVAQVPGVTHVCDQKTYEHPDEAPVPFTDLTREQEPGADR